MKKSKNTTNIIEDGQMTLWQSQSLGLQTLGEKLKMTQTKNKDGDVVSESIKPLPMRSDKGPSMESLTGFTGQKLMMATRQATDDLKKAMCHLAMEMGQSSRFTAGGGIRLSRSGRVTLSYKLAPGITIESYTIEELQARIEQMKAEEAAEAKAEKKAKGNAKGNGKGNGQPKQLEAANA